VASFELRWMGDLGRAQPDSAADMAANQFTFDGILTHATLGWSASVPASNFEFRSAPAHTSKETFAEVVRERNGVFFED